MQLPEREQVPRMPEPWVSVEQVADHLACSTDSIYPSVARRGLPGPRVGRGWRFQISAVGAWVRNGGANERADKAAG